MHCYLQAVMARRRRRRPPGGQTTAAGSGRRRAPFSTDNLSHTHTARSLACPLLTLSSARPFSNGIFRSHGAPASLPPASSCACACAAFLRSTPRRPLWSRHEWQHGELHVDADDLALGELQELREHRAKALSEGGPQLLLARVPREAVPGRVLVVVDPAGEDVLRPQI